MTKARVLVVEDNPTEQKLVAMLATRMGVEADIAGTAYKAIDLLRGGHPYSAILMNWLMPCMDGMECTEKIRQMESQAGRRTPIILLTARALEDEREACLQAGMDDYLTKPYTVAEFEATLHKWLEDAKSQGYLQQSGL